MYWASILEWLKQHFQDIVTLVTFGSLILALWQIREARKQTKNLEQIQGSLSTRYIGDLTRYYPEVISLIENAKKSIIILCDYPAYGCFTNSIHWRSYYNVLVNKKVEGKVRIIFTCPEATVRHETDENEYFPKATEEEWSNWKIEDKNREQLRMFLLNTPDKNQQNIGHSTVEKFIDDLSREGFLEMLQLADRWMLQNCFVEEEGNFIKNTPPIDFWIVDGMSAIFALTDYDAGMSRYGFKTTDQKLIDALQKTKDYYSSRESSQVK
jgi:hypothetical protein